MKEKIHPSVIGVLQERPMSRVIVRAKSGKFWSLIEHLKPFSIKEFLRGDRDREFLRRIAPQADRRLDRLNVMRFERFGLAAALLPRELIFDLGEADEVEAVFPDYFRFANGPLNNRLKLKRGLFGDEIEFATTVETKRLLGLDTAEKIGYTGKGAKVAVLDTGASRNHEMLRGRATFDSALLEQGDLNGHGTWCTSCVGGAPARDDRLSRQLGREVMATGMATGCDLISIKVLESLTGGGYDSGILRGLEMAAEVHKAKIISLSLGGEYKETDPEAISYFEPFRDLVNAGMIPVIAAGNSGPDAGTVNSPGCLPNVITIGAIDPHGGDLAEFSSRGPTKWGGIKPDFTAPGVNIHCGATGLLDYAGDQTRNKFSPLSGTSMATPHIAGLVAVAVAAYERHNLPPLTVAELQRLGAELGTPKTNQGGWGSLTWGMIQHWMSTEHGVEVN